MAALLSLTGRPDSESWIGVFKTTEEWGFAAPAIFKINLLYGYIDLMTSPPYTDG